VLLLAAASLLPLAAISVLKTSASEFTDKCTAASQGMFNDQDCNCMDSRAAAPDERQDLLAFFDANIAEQQGGPKPDENSPQIKRGSTVLNKLLDQCLK
jgi:hypothetical protein